MTRSADDMSGTVQSGPMQEIGCPHDFGVVYNCPTCFLPRSCSTDPAVTRRCGGSEEPNGGPWPTRQLRPEDQETIMGMRSDNLMATLREMVDSGRERHDPTLSIALSLDAVAFLLDRAAR